MSNILCCIPYTIGWLIIVLTVSTDGPAFRPLLFTGRFVVGIAAGWSAACFNVSLIVYCTQVYACNNSQVLKNIGEKLS